MYRMLSYLIFRTGAVSGTVPVYSEQWIQMNRYMYYGENPRNVAINSFLSSLSSLYTSLYIPGCTCRPCVAVLCVVIQLTITLFCHNTWLLWYLCAHGWTTVTVDVFTNLTKFATRGFSYKEKPP